MLAITSSNMLLAFMAPTAAPPPAPTCGAFTNCSDCTADATCGFCDGIAVLPSGDPAPKCLPLNSVAGWKCVGTLLNKGQCTCKAAPISDFLNATWRGFYLDGSVKGEIALELFKTGVTSRAKLTLGGKARFANATSFTSCGRPPEDELLFAFDTPTPTSSHMACTYRAGWQDGGDAHTIAIGCNNNASMPPSWDLAEVPIVLYKCVDPQHCDFKPPPPPPAPPSVLANTAAELEAFVETVLKAPQTDPCASLSTCGECSKGPSCTWCMGTFTENGKELDGKGHCFGAQSGSVQCHGLSLDKGTCDVYACDWKHYYNNSGAKADCAALEASCNKGTTADDPCFKRPNTPCFPYTDKQECQRSCKDPTLGCKGSTCVRTGTCDPTSNCHVCTDKLPTVLQGIEISKGYTAGIWTFEFNQTNGTYTGVNITAPFGDVSLSRVYQIKGFKPKNATANLPAQGQLVLGDVPQHSAIFDINANGAFGKNMYFAYGTKDLDNWGEGAMYPRGNDHPSEFALMACQYSAGEPVSGENHHINCDIGDLAN